MSQQHLVDRARVLARIDLAPSDRPPATISVVLLTAASVVVSLLADTLIVKIATLLVPSVKGYGHFRFSDYGLLTTIGVIAAGTAWPVVTRITSSPRWLFIRLAVVVTLVLFLPDVWLILKGEPGRAVVALMLMHLVIALVTYNLLVHGAPVRPTAGASAASARAVTGNTPAAGAVPADTGGVAPAGVVPTQPAAGPGAVPADTGGVVPTQPAAPAPRLWIAMSVATGVEFLLGIAGLVVVPLGRPSGWLPARGEALYLATRRGCRARGRRSAAADPDGAS